MMMSGRHSCRATSTGTLLATPPSANSLPSILTGTSALGIDMLARIALASSPEPNTTGEPVARSVATAR